MVAAREPAFSEADVAWADRTWGEGNWVTVWVEESERWMMAHKNNPKVADDDRP